MNRTAAALLLLACAMAATASAANWDTSGNDLLKGTYYFRNVVWLVGDDSGNLGRAIAVYGNINFDGNGNYTLTNAQVMDSNANGPQSFSTTGTYSISASGFGFLSSPVSKGDSVYGLVSRGIFIGSSTESTFNDLFIAAPLASPLPANGSFSGTYSMVDVDFPTGSPLDTRDSQFDLNPDGNGNIGNVRATGYIGGNGTSVVTQNIGGVRYFFSNGGANVNFGGSLTANNLIAGTKYLYMSADGAFVFGGSPTAWDMIVGVRTGTATPTFGGLYYQAGIVQDESQLSFGSADLNTYYGSMKATSGIILAHQRLLSLFANNALDYTYSDSYTLKSDGTYNDVDHHYFFGSGGAIRIGLGINTSLGINVAIQAPSFQAPGVYVNPTGVLNAASSSMFTAGIAPGELITLYGTNLAPDFAADSSFPFTLGGVQVMINGRPAPIYVVSPNQISAVVPFATNELIAAIQVINNNVSSNTVTSFVGLTAPGVFTKPEGGIGYAAALHPDYSLVTSAHPAQAGETVSIFVTGLGAVSPAVADGAPGPASTFSLTTNSITVLIGNQKAVTSFVGLAPGLVGLYQINAKVPSGVTPGDASVDVAGPDFYTRQALLPIGPGTAPASIGEAVARMPVRVGPRVLHQRDAHTAGRR